MKFFSLEDSKKLAEVGCKSESDHILAIWNNKPILLSIHNSGKTHGVLAFHPYDFLGDTEQARRNCEILWPSYERIIRPIENPGCYGTHTIEDVPLWPNKRKEMLSSPDHIEFVRGFLK